MCPFCLKNWQSELCRDWQNFLSFGYFVYEMIKLVDLFLTSFLWKLFLYCGWAALHLEKAKFTVYDLNTKAICSFHSWTWHWILFSLYHLIVFIVMWVCILDKEWWIKCYYHDLLHYLYTIARFHLLVCPFLSTEKLHNYLKEEVTGLIVFS